MNNHNAVNTTHSSTPKPAFIASLCLGSVLLFPLSVAAATFTYDGGGANVFLNEDANWVGGVAPTSMENDFIITSIPSGKEAKFGINLPGNTRSIIFDSSATSMEVFGTPVANYIAFAAGGNSLTIQNNSVNSQTFSLQLRQYWIGGADPDQRTWDAANGDIVLNGSVLLLGDSGGSSAKSLRLAGSGNFIFNNSIVAGGFSGGNQQVGIRKTGSGIVALNADSSTLAGSFDVEAGTLLVQNASGSATGAGELTIHAGARLAGTGNITGAIVLAAGSSLAPGGVDSDGNSLIGTLTGTSLVWNSDNASAGFMMQLLSDPAASDQVILTGSFFKGEGSEFIIDFSGSTLINGTVYTLVTFGLTNFQASDFVAMNANGIFAIDGNSLTFTAIPESSSSVMIGSILIGSAVVFIRRRRCRR